MQKHMNDVVSTKTGAENYMKLTIPIHVGHKCFANVSWWYASLHHRVLVTGTRVGWGWQTLKRDGENSNLGHQTFIANTQSLEGQC